MAGDLNLLQYSKAGDRLPTGVPSPARVNRGFAHWPPRSLTLSRSTISTLRRSFILLGVFAAAALASAQSFPEIRQLVESGHWQEAQAKITLEQANTNASFSDQEDLLFLRDRMHRMSRDFTQTRAEVEAAIRRLAPRVTEQQLADWEHDGSIEFLDVDGTRWYFHQAARNLFRINPSARSLLTEAAYNSLFGTPDATLPEIQEALTNYDRTGETCNTPRTWRVTYQISVKPDQVPAGETVRAWLPFPHTLNRQADIRLISTEPARHLAANTNDALCSIYLEKPAVLHEPTVFQEVFEYTASAFFEPIDPARVTPVNTNDPAIAACLGERPPNIVFTDEIKNLSREIVGSETNPYLKARLIFKWVNEHVTWASAREYGTLDCLPAYALPHHHGDCGMQAMTFMTFCRYNGIPAHWETGWVVGDSPDMHDWCEIYLAPYGWVPVDVTFGFMDSNVDREKWFYLGGIDGYRLVVNSDYNQPLYPEKSHFRSEVIDFQRGEVEWRFGNLYFDQWDWNFHADEVKPRAE